MKTMRILCACLVVAVLVAPAAVEAGPFGPNPSNDAAEQIAKLFGDNTAFTATAIMAMKGKIATKAGSGAEMAYAYLDGKLRTEIDMTKMAGDKNADASAAMAALGMDRMVFVVRPDKKMTYVIVPGLNAYSESPIPTDAKTGELQPPKIEKTELGRETVAGHPCVKYKVVITSESGRVVEMTTWQATDLKDFPVQTEIVTGSDAVTMQFKDVKFVKPPAGLFEVPPGATRYGTMQEMMMGAMKQLLAPPGSK